MDLRVSWRTVAVSVPGISHIEQDLPCQDECWSEASPPESRSRLLIVVADGAGSAQAGDVGARLCVETVVQAAHEHFARADAPLDETTARAIFARAREAILGHAATQSLMPRDLASTLVCALFDGQCGVVFQIGDGALVLKGTDGMWIPIAPMNGEYANSTRFVSDDDALNQVAVVLIEKPVTQIAAFTDGIQSIGVHRASGQPHPPFFQPLFDTLARAGTESEDALAHGLQSFLSSDGVNQRTDDDKTLALAVWQS